jgi:hypothetical protein
MSGVNGSDYDATLLAIVSVTLTPAYLTPQVFFSACALVGRK